MAKGKKPIEETAATEETVDGQGAAGVVVPPHLDDQRARDYIVHLTAEAFPGRDVVPVRNANGRSHTFRRGKGGDLTHTINLTPPQARDLRLRKFAVMEKE